MAHDEAVHQQIVQYSQHGQSLGHISHKMGLGPDVMTAHLNLEHVRQASAQEPESPQLEVERLMAKAAGVSPYLQLTPPTPESV